MSGKAYANRKKESERPDNDYYPTPSCMIEALLESGLFLYFLDNPILDPCCGKYAIGNVLKKHGFNNIKETDVIYGQDFLTVPIPEEPVYDAIIMNPPFKLFDQFVERAKKFAYNVYSIGKLNYFGGHNRNINGLWDKLMYVLPFDRMIAFDKSEDEHGKVETGMMVTGWFIWRRDYNGLPMIKVLDMQKYIKRK